MLLKDLSLPTPQENLLFDETLLHLAEEGAYGEVLRFWESSVLFIVLGRISKEREDLNLAAINRDKIPVFRRSSGGGTVVQGRGCLNYTLILSKEKHPILADVRKSYDFILGQVVLALKKLKIDCLYLPISDIALTQGYKKISGNAQRRLRKYILHHGTILYDFDLSAIQKYLSLPKDMPTYRNARQHTDFVTNIGVPPDKIKTELKRIFSVEREERELTLEEKLRLKELVTTKIVRIDTESLEDGKIQGIAR